MLPTYLKDHPVPDDREFKLIVNAWLRWIAYYSAPRSVRRTTTDWPDGPMWPGEMIDRVRNGEPPGNSKPL